MMGLHCGGTRGPMSTQATTGTQAVDRAALLVSTVVRADEPLTFAELQSECGLPKSTTSRMLTALERTELLERNHSGSYIAGPLFWLYASRHDPWEELVRLARPTLERVGADTGETVNLSVARGDRVVQVAQVDSTLPPRHPGLDRRRRARPLLRARQGDARLRASTSRAARSTSSPRTPSPTTRRCDASWTRSSGAAGRARSTSSRSASPASAPPCAAPPERSSRPWASQGPAHGWPNDARRSAGC